MKKLLITFAALLMLPLTAAAQDSRLITASEAWTTPSLTENANGAVFLTLTNDGDKPVTITGAHSPRVERAELHSMRTTKDGVMMMERLLQAEVPAKSKLVFKPEDLHVMIFGVRGKLKAGDSFPLTLDLARGGSIGVNVEVRPLAAKLEEAIKE